MAQTPVVQTPAAPPPPPTAQAPSAPPQTPPAATPNVPAQMNVPRPVPAPPPPPLNPETLPLQQPPVPVIDLDSPGIEVTLPSKIVVSGIAAVVDGKPITYQYLVTKFLAAGAPQFLDEMINEQLIRQEAAKEGVVVSKAEVDEKLLEAKKYLLQQYPGETWGQFLALQGRSESYIRDNIYDGLLAVKLVEKAYPPSLAGKVHLFHILKLTVSVPGGPTPLADDVAKSQIEAIRDLIVSGKATFQDEARKESQDSSASKGGDLGWVGKDAQFDPAFSAAAFSLAEGEVSQPVKSQYGWHLIYAERFGEHATKADLDAFAASSDEQNQARARIQQYLKDLRTKSKVINNVLPSPPTPSVKPIPIVITPHFTTPIAPAPAKKTVTKKATM